MVGIRGSSHPFTSFSFTRVNRLRLLNEFALLESALREDLNSRAIRVSAVVNPVKLVITNYPEGQVEELEAINNPEKPEEGSHFIEFSRELWMEREDFMEDAPKKIFPYDSGTGSAPEECLYRRGVLRLRDNGRS